MVTSINPLVCLRMPNAPLPIFSIYSFNTTLIFNGLIIQYRFRAVIYLIAAYFNRFYFRTMEMLSKHDELRFNNASIFYTMEQFVETVQRMESTILFPSRLVDLSTDDLKNSLGLEDNGDSIIITSLTNTDLYHLYKIISQMKVDLMCSRQTNHSNKPMKTSMSEPQLKYTRTWSSTSMQSVQSTCTSCDSESDIVTEIDSEEEGEDHLSAICKVFKRHLHELNCNIQKLTSIAEYIILRYQISIKEET
ncbi:uncharacterized protein LOC143431016 [Xylocopa sonorina]|uniref:uncharacterized protein LOC143431016 n=1 Tax=Xylocopa sonorina TaxID=1818115 RepID=UPI00403B2C13